MFDLIKRHKLLFLLFFVLILYMCIDKGVFATTNPYFNTSYISDTDVNTAKSKVGNTIWNDETYDIFVFYNAGTATKCVVYYQPILIYNDIYYTCIYGGAQINGYDSFTLSLISNGHEISRGQRICKSLPNNWDETSNSVTSTNNISCYWFYSRINNSNSIYCKPIRTHFDIKDLNGNVIFPATNPVAQSHFHLEYDNSNDYPIVYSNWYDFLDENNEGIFRETMFKYQHYYGYSSDSNYAFTSFSKDSRDVQGWKNMEGNENDNGPGYVQNHTEDYTELPEDLQWRVGYQITDYGTYYFCQYDVENDTYNIERFIINHNEVSSYFYNANTGQYDSLTTYNASEVSNVIDTVSAYDYLSLKVEQNNSVGSIFTNWLNWNNGYIYEVYWSKDRVNWNGDISYEEGFSNHRRYILDVVENGTYYIKLRIFDSNGVFIKDVVESAIINSIGVTEFSNDIDLILSKNIPYNLFKDSLGVLFYPIDLTIQFFQRLSTITELEPTITVPSITEVFTGRTLINGFTFSLADILENENIAVAYNIYLLFADFIVYGWLLRFFYKVCKDFMNIHGGVA